MKHLLITLGILTFLFTMAADTAFAFHSRQRVRKPPIVIPPPVVPPSNPPTTPPTNPPQTNEIRWTGFITAYASGDNDPPNTTTTWLDGIGGNAKGDGTYSNPTTVAVKQGAYKYGTIFYIPNLQRYFRAEDSCASCSNKQLDVYVGDYSGAGVNKCESDITGNFLVIQNPAPNYKVTKGDIYNGTSCTKQFGNVIY